MFTRNFFSPVYHDADDGSGSGAPADDIEIPDDVDLSDIAPEGEPAEFEVPDELPEGVEQFDRQYVQQLRDEAAARRVEARELKEQFGDVTPEVAAQGAQLVARLQTREGVVELTEAALESFGMEPEDIKTFLEGLTNPDAVATFDEDDPDLDLPMTKRELLELQRNDRLAATRTAEEQRQAQAQEAFQESAKAQIVSAFTTLEVTDEAERQVLLSLGDAIAAEAGIDQTDVTLIPEVLKLAKERYDEQTKAAARKLVAAKVAQKQTSPKTLGGGGTEGGGDAPPKENRTLAEVIADRKARDKAARTG